MNVLLTTNTNYQIGTTFQVDYSTTLLRLQNLGSSITGLCNSSATSFSCSGGGFCGGAGPIQGGTPADFLAFVEPVAAYSTPQQYAIKLKPVVLYPSSSVSPSYTKTPSRSASMTASTSETPSISISSLVTPSQSLSSSTSTSTSPSSKTSTKAPTPVPTTSPTPHSNTSTWKSSATVDSFSFFSEM